MRMRFGGRGVCIPVVRLGGLFFLTDTERGTADAFIVESESESESEDPSVDESPARMSISWFALDGSLPCPSGSGLPVG